MKFTAEIALLSFFAIIFTCNGVSLEEPDSYSIEQIQQINPYATSSVEQLSEPIIQGRHIRIPLVKKKLLLLKFKKLLPLKKLFFFGKGKSMDELIPIVNTDNEETLNAIEEANTKDDIPVRVLDNENDFIPVQDNQEQNVYEDEVAVNIEDLNNTPPMHRNAFVEQPYYYYTPTQQDIDYGRSDGRYVIYTNGRQFTY